VRQLFEQKKLEVVAPTALKGNARTLLNLREKNGGPVGQKRLKIKILNLI
jgi:hypothetical protein